MKVFAIPAALTVGLLGWWLYACVADVHFPAHQATNNAGMFNTVLFSLVFLSWVAAIVIHEAGDGK